jgi:hypothetical protein
VNVRANADKEQDATAAAVAATTAATAAAAASDDDDDDVVDDDNDADENDVNDRATTQTTSIFVIQFRFLFIYMQVNSLCVRYKNRTRTGL